MYRVVYVMEPTPGPQFSQYVSILNQGASLEGIYNGFAHSSFYRRLEEQNPGARLEAFAVFVDLLSRFESQMKSPTLFTETSALPLQHPDDPAVPENEGTEEALHFGTHAPAQATAVGTSADRVKHLFASSSIFTLKRVLGDEAMKLFDEKKQDPKALAAWYAKETRCMRSLTKSPSGLRAPIQRMSSLT